MISLKRPLSVAALFGLLLTLTLAAVPGPAAWAQDATTPTDPAAVSLDPAAGIAAPAVPEVPDTASPIDYVVWDRVAIRAEQALEAGRASDQALQTLRGELVQWREVFTKARAENQVRISTLKTQINTLGPPPAEGQTEPAILTDTRAALTAQLEEAQAPVKAAELALARANALVAQVDTTLRGRQTDALLALGPTPLNPAFWPKAIDDVVATARLTWNGIKSSVGTETQRAELWQNLPVALIFAVGALVLLMRGRAWVIRAGAQVRGRAKGPAKGVWGFLISLGQFAAPLAGVYALVEAFHYAGILGLRAQVIADDLPILGLSFFLSRWLGNRVFGVAGSTWQVLNLPISTRAEGRFHAATLGLLYGLGHILEKVAAYETYSDTTTAVLTFPIVAFAGFLLFRLGQLLRGHSRAETAAAEDGVTFMTRTLALAGLALILAGLAGPFAAAVGYTKLADSFVFPSALTVGLVGGLLVLHGFFIDVYGLIFKADEERATEALLPVLASFAVAVLSIPLLALIWGARVTDLTEIWTRLGQGVTIGGAVISPSDLITFAIVFAIGYGATRLVQGTLKTTVLPKTRMDIGGQNAITSGIGYVGLFLAAVVAITSAGIDLSSLAIVAGALSVGIGFGLQNIVSNFVSGVILLVERPISEGDWIEVGGQMGIVKDISVRSTRIETFDRSDVILPNSDLISGVVTNYTRGNQVGRVIVPVGVAYGTDTKKVEAILREIAEAHPLVTVNPPPSVYFMEFGADSLNFEIRAILRDVNFKLAVHSEINHEIARRFVEEGIEVPFAQRDIWLRNPEALNGAGAAPAPKPKKRKKPAEKPPVKDAESARAALDVSDMSETHGYGPHDEDD
jgi:potassium-dependent mechanosensitive channel